MYHSGIVRSTCHIIWQYLQPIVMLILTKEIWLQIAARSQSVASFPNCIDAVYGKHIHVQQPLHSGLPYFSYKNYFFVVLMVLVDASYKYVAINGDS